MKIFFGFYKLVRAPHDLTTLAKNENEKRCIVYLQQKTKFFPMHDPFDRIPTDQILAFLKSVLEKDQQLQREFERFVENNVDPGSLIAATKQSVPDPEAIIAETAGNIRRELEALNLDEPDWESYVPRSSGYIPEYKAAEHMAEDEITAVLDEFYHTAENHVRAKRYDHAVLVMIGCYDGCMEAELESEYTFSEPREFMLSVLANHVQKLTDLLNIATVPYDHLYIFTWAVFHHATIHYDREPDFLQFYQGLLISLVESREQASLVRKAFHETQLAPEDIPLLHLKVVKYLDGPDAWEQTALGLSAINDTIAGDLLSLYANRGDKEKFLTLANDLWKRYQCRQDVAVLFFTRLRREDDPCLYKEVVLHLTATYREEQYYQAFMQVSASEERQAFRSRFRHDAGFYSTMLRLEGLYDEALDFLDKKVDFRTFAKLIGQFTDLAPDRCFGLISTRTREIIQKERGRHLYEDIVACLKAASNIPGCGEAMYRLVNELYNRKPALPSLRRELTAAGLTSYIVVRGT